MNEYKVVKDGNKWGVIDTNDIFVNEDPISKSEAIKLANACNTPESGFYVDNDPHELYLD